MRDGRICKFMIERTGQTTLPLTAGFKVLDVQAQAGKIAVWVVYDDQQEIKANVTMSVYATGAEYPDHLKYAGTVQFDSGHLAAHVFY